LSGGNASADSFNARSEVKKKSGRATELEVRESGDLCFEVEDGGRLPREGNGGHMGFKSREVSYNHEGVLCFVFKAVYPAP
jgi:hypothetical protein